MVQLPFSAESFPMSAASLPMFDTKLISLLDELEHALKAALLWRDEMPTAQALASQAPFGCDLLAFEEWLQFIFLPRFRTLLETGQALPSAMSVLPMAQHVWGTHADKETLLIILANLDDAVNGK
ncbi:YqcC family protein [Shewanella sp. FJAT-52076]|uniref:YqcC family protein n=1 Tax=Shewanella sp. FJAT-52076 TaxID=2864202 RepID=UPI001C65E3E6|nr:YqcC family protein [Shewanella sp. FJAT-52076]QYJ76478.1 YqcC family protein [Shewanella sp. FJAT-52076]